MTWIHSILLGMVEGLTEFLPISSTGHLILVGQWLGIASEKTSTFEIFIQLGAILAVVCLYHQRVFGLFRFDKNWGFSGIHGIFLLFLTTLPVLLLGWLFYSQIKGVLFHPKPVAMALAAGGLVLIGIEKFLPRPVKTDLDALNWHHALIIGLFQCLALFPGMSRSAATICGALLIGVDSKTSAEYSFLAAIPVLFMATGYDLLKNWSLLSAADIPIFAIGFVVSFIFALIAVKTFIRLIGRCSLAPFGWYRLVLAGIVLFVWNS